MLSSQGGQSANNIGTTILNQRSWYDLESACQRPEWPLMNAGNRLGLLLQQLGNLHLASAAAWHQIRVDHHVSCHVHRVLKVAFHLVEHVLASAAQYDRARLGVFALLNERVVLLADLTDLEQAGAHTNVFLADLVSAADHCCTASSSNNIAINIISLFRNALRIAITWRLGYCQICVIVLWQLCLL